MARRLHLRAAWALILCVAASTASAADVAIVKSSDVAAWQPTLEALRVLSSQHTLEEFTLAQTDNMALLARLRGHADVIVALGPAAAQFAHAQVAHVPLVHCLVPDPDAAGLLHAPNVVGIAALASVRHELAAFRAVNPKARRLGTFVSGTTAELRAEEARKLAGTLGLEIVVRKLARAADLPPATRALLAGDEPVDALWLLPDALLVDPVARRFLLAEAVRSAKPVYGWSTELLPEGLLVAHGPELRAIGRSAADAVMRLLAGQKAERLVPLVPPSQVTVNRNVARYLGLKLTPEAERAVTLY